MLPSLRRLIALSIPLWLALGAPAAQADVYCVGAPVGPPACDFGFAGPDPQPAIDAAIAHLGNDTVRLAAGTYTGFSAAGSGGTTTITGAGRTQTTISDVTAGAVVQLQGDIIVESMAIERTAGAGNVVNSSAVPLRDVDIARTGGTGVVVTFNNNPPGGEPALSNVTITAPAAGLSDHALSTFGTTIENVQIEHDGSDYAIFATDLKVRRSTITSGAVLAAIYATGTSVVENSRVTTTGTDADGISAGTSSADSTVTVRDSTLLSTAPGATGSGVAASVFNVAARATVDVRGVAVRGFARTACAGTGPSAGLIPAAVLTVSYSAGVAGAPVPCPTGGSSSYTNPAGTLSITNGPGIVAAEPQFANVGGGDYTPLPGGNLIDAGDPAALTGSELTVDLLGAARVTDGSGDGVARRDIGALEGAAVPFVPVPGGGGSGGGSSAPSNPKVLTVRFAGTLKRASVTRSVALTPISKAPSGSKPGFTITLDRAPATLTFRVARRGSSGKYSTLKGSVSLVASGTTLRLRPSGSWNRKRLAKGTYQLRVSAPDGATKSATFKIK